MRRFARTTLLALLLVVAWSAAPSVALAEQAGGPPKPTTEDYPPSDGANFTVSPATTGDHQPGAQGSAYVMLSKGEQPWGDSEGLREVDFYKITTQETQFQDCTPNNARAFGIDRGNDDPGTQTDEPLLQHMKSYSVEGRVIVVEIYDEEDIAGNPTHLNRSDETVAKLDGCINTPEKPGWYQFTGYVNGTNYDGEYQEVTLYSKYFWVCECQNEAEARQKLGPPPYSGGSGGGDGSDGDGSTGGGDSTPTGTATPGDGGDGSDGGAGTGGDGDGGDGSAGGGDGSAGGDSTPTGTATPGDGSDGTPTVTPGDDATATPGDGTATATGTDDGPNTPTGGDGPGFGALAALLGLLGAALLATRRG